MKSSPVEYSHLKNPDSVCVNPRALTRVFVNPRSIRLPPLECFSASNHVTRSPPKLVYHLTSACAVPFPSIDGQTNKARLSSTQDLTFLTAHRHPSFDPYRAKYVAHNCDIFSLAVAIIKTEFVFEVFPIGGTRLYSSSSSRPVSSEIEPDNIGHRNLTMRRVPRWIFKHPRGAIKIHDFDRFRDVAISIHAFFAEEKFFTPQQISFNVLCILQTVLWI